MSGYLKQKMSVSPLVQELSSPRSLHGQAAKNERWGREAQILIRLLPFQADTGDCVITNVRKVVFVMKGGKVFKNVKNPADASRPSYIK
jgi:hypothetical protein